MIIKARAGTGGQALANYLQGDKNDHAEVLGYRNMDAASLSQAIYFMDALAKGGRCENHALHVQMRAAPNERLSSAMWEAAALAYAEAFGMQDHQAAMVLHHQPDGCTHCHLVFNRVNPETLKAADLWQNYKVHKELARTLEIDYGLQRVTNHKTKTRDYSNASRPETEQAKRAGRDIHDIRDRIRTAWEGSKDGQGFKEALDNEGFVLAKGDRRDFVAVDDTGHAYSIGKRTTGATAEETRAKLADLDREAMPTLQQVRIDKGLESDFDPELKKERKGKKSGDAASSGHFTPFEKWEKENAERVDRLRETHAEQAEKLDKHFDKLETKFSGEASDQFNGKTREDAKEALYKKQAEELAAMYGQQEKGREAYSIGAAIKQQREEIRRTKAGGMKKKTHLRRELENLQKKAAHIRRYGFDYQQGENNQQAKYSKDFLEPKESWMEQGCGFKLGGYDNLSDEHKQAARKSFDMWRSTGDKNQQAKREGYSLEDYVSYVQKKEAERQRAGYERDKNQTYEEKRPFIDTGAPSKGDREAAKAEFLAWCEELKNHKKDGRNFNHDKATLAEEYTRQKDTIFQLEGEKLEKSKLWAAYQKEKHERRPPEAERGFEAALRRGRGRKLRPE